MRRLQWLAGANGTEHATAPLDRWRTLCGAKQVTERLAYPADRRCHMCELRAEKMEVTHSAAD